MPRLLDADLRETARLTPVKLALNLTLLPLSTAVLTLPGDAPEIALRDLIELYDENGSVGIFRVKEIVTDVGRTQTVALEHALCTLQDSVMPAQGFTCSVAEALQRILDCQTVPRWTVGEVEAPDDLTVIFATDYADLLTAVKSLLGMLPEGYALDFDQTVIPWQLHIRALSATAECEGRLSRNLQSVRHETDSSHLCTCLYPFGAEVDTGRISLMLLTGSDHILSPEADVLGTISHTFQSDLIFDAPTLQAVAQLYLARHAVPETVTRVDGLDLSAATGESLDAFRLGRMCRLALPDNGLTLTEQIIALHKPDVYGAPGQVELTLSNQTKHQNEAREIEELVRQVTAGKLLGGSVTEIVVKNRAFGSYPSPVVHYFDVEDWAALLDVRVEFKPDIGASVIDLRVDETHPADEVWKGRSFSAMPYLKRDELGQIAQGRHHIVYHPSTGTYGEECGVTSTITLTVITKTTT